VICLIKRLVCYKKNIVETDEPMVVYPESKYQYPCSDAQNLRNTYCPEVTDISNISHATENEFEIYPNVTTSFLTIEITTNIKAERINIYNLQGQLMQTEYIKKDLKIKVDVSQLVKGLYFISAGYRKAKFVKE
jgi:hypothetical protein